MTAMTGDRPTATAEGKMRNREVAANARIWNGALVALNATGFAVPGTTALGLTADGIARARADNTGGADGAIRVEVEPANMWLANSAGGDVIARKDVGKTAYIVDDQTVALTNGGGTRSVAGTILAVSSTLGVLVAVGIAHQ